MFGFGRGRRGGRWFGPYPWEGPGYNRWLVAQQARDPERAMFGLGLCGEIAYQQYKKNKEQTKI